MQTNHTIFISSTFKDMHYERDLIHERVIPELCSSMEGNVDNVDFVDLRWGINTENINDETQTAQKILQVCFDEIERSRPFFVCLIGNRYGWIPTEESVKGVCMNAGLGTDPYLGKSITEIEIEYAMSKLKKYDNCYFFFRNGIAPEDIADEEIRDIYFPKDTEEDSKNQLLRRRIRRQYPDRCFDYTCSWDNAANAVVGLADLAELIVGKISAALSTNREQNRKLQDAYGKEAAAQESYLQSVLSNCVFRQEYLDQLINDFILADTEQKELILLGESGFGKSTLLATLGQTLRQSFRNDIYVLNFFSGITVESLDFRFAVSYIYKKVARDFEYPADGGDFPDIKQKLYSLLSEISKQKRIVIILDAINQLNRCAELDSLDWLNHYLIPENVRIVYSSTPASADTAIARRNIRQYWLNELKPEEVALIANAAASRRHKQLPDVAYDILLAKRDSKGNLSCANPLYVSMVIELISEFDMEDYQSIMKLEQELQNGAKAINRYVADKLRTMPGEIDALYELLLERCKKNISDAKAELITSLLSTSRFGLREGDIYGISGNYGLSISVAEFSVYRKLLRMHLIRRTDGRWDFKHSIIKKGVAKENHAIDQTKKMAAICRYLRSLPIEDAFRREEIAFYHLQNGLFDAFLESTKHGAMSAVEQREVFCQLCELYANGINASNDFWEACRSSGSLRRFCEIIFEIMDEGICRSIDYRKQLNLFLTMNGALQKELRAGSSNYSDIVRNYIECGKCMYFVGDKRFPTMFQVALRVTEKRCMEQYLENYVSVLRFLVNNNRYGDSLRAAKMMYRSLRRNRQVLPEYRECLAYCSYYMAVSLKGDPVSVSTKTSTQWLCLAIQNAPIDSELFLQCATELSGRALHGQHKDVFENAIRALQSSGKPFLDDYRHLLIRMNISDTANRAAACLDLMERLKKTLIANETYEVLVLYQQCVEEYYYIAVSEQRFDPDTAQDSVQLNRSLCKKLFSMTGDRLWIEKEIEIDEDALQIKNSDAGFRNSTETDLRKTAEIAMDLPSKGYSTRFHQFVFVLFWVLLFSVFVSAFAILPLFSIIKGKGISGLSDTLNTVLGGGFGDVLQFLNAFVIGLCTIQIHRVLYFHTKKGFSYQYEKKKLVQYIALSLSFLSVEFLFGAIREGLFAWYQGKELVILGDMLYYIQNAILVFILAWHVTLLIYWLIQLRTRSTKEKKQFRRTAYFREVVAASWIRLGIMAALPALFYATMKSNLVMEKSLTYTGRRAEDFWAIHWLPFTAELLLLGCQFAAMLRSRKKFSEQLNINSRNCPSVKAKKRTCLLRYLLVPLALYIFVGSFISFELAYGKDLQLRKEEARVEMASTETYRYYFDDKRRVVISKYIGEEETAEIPAQIDGAVVIKLDSKCFSGSGVRTVIVPETIEFFGTAVFRDCKKLETIILPDKMTFIPSQTFFGCSSLCSLQLPAAVTKIDEYAFMDCSSLTQIRFPEQLQEIGDNAFANCGLIELTIPASVTDISGNAFADCKELEELTFESEGIKLNAVSTLESLKVLRFGSETTYCSLQSYFACPQLETIEIGKSVQSLMRFIVDREYSADCFPSLKEIVIDPENPNFYSGNLSICRADHTLYGIYADGTIPEDTVSISADAFFAYRGETLWIPKTVVEIIIEGDSISFSEITTLRSIEVDPENPVYYSADGKLFLKQTGALLFDPTKS